MADLRQDWEPVVVRKKAPTSSAKKDEKTVNAARRAGAELETVKKCTVFFICSTVFPIMISVCFWELLLDFQP